MKIVAINGSARKKGNTSLVLDAMVEVFQAEGIQCERIDIGEQAIQGCVGCGACRKMQNRKCRFDDDPVNAWTAKLIEADGMIVGSPVYYAGMNGSLKSFLDRAFFVASANGSLLRHKVGAGIVAVRRGGSVTALDQIYKYFTISEMYMASGTYWNMIYGMEPGEAAKDEEGMQCARILAANTAWLMKVMEEGKKTLSPPPILAKSRMNFIR